jgi:L-lactate dehydrogenase complex protein LldG
MGEEEKVAEAESNMPTETTEQSFLENVAKALGRSQPLTDAPARTEAGPPAFWREQRFEADEPLQYFTKNLEALSGRVSVVGGALEASRQVNAWLDELKAKTVILWDHPELRQYVNIGRTDITVQYWSGDQSSRVLITAAEEADVGITWADYAIGYSGTLALLSGPNKGRSVSLLPPSHIAVFKKSNLVPTMSYVIRDLNELAGTGKLPATIDFITGPSRTSDIEMDLSIGVHGPYRVWTIVIDE